MITASMLLHRISASGIQGTSLCDVDLEAKNGHGCLIRLILITSLH
jgi:hypothetical protein